MLNQFILYKTKQEWENIHSKMRDSAWDDFTLDRQGTLTEWLTLNHRDEYRDYWNRLVKESKPAVKEYVANLTATQNINNDLATHLEWDLLNLLIEQYYQKTKRGTFVLLKLYYAMV